MPRKARLGELLIQAGLIDELQLSRALGEQKQWGTRLGVTLLRLGFVREPELVRVLARQLGVPAVHLHGKTVDPEVLALVPAELAEKFRCVPLFRKREGGLDLLFVGFEDPCNLQAIDDLSFRTGKRIRPVLVGPSEISEALARFYGDRLEGEALLEGSFVEAPLEPDDTAPVLTGLAEDPLAPDPGEPTRQPERPPAAQAATAAPHSGPAQAAAPGRPTREGEVSTRSILRAVTELLIEKGVIRREELLSRLQRPRKGA